DIEWNDVARQAQGVQAGVARVNLRLNLLEVAGHLAQLGDGGAVDLLDAGVVRIDRRENGIPDHPIQVRALTGARSPFGEAPGAGWFAVFVPLPLPGRVLDVIGTVGEVHDLRSGARLRGGGRREFSFIEVIHRRTGAADQDFFGARSPGEVVVRQQAVV